MGVGKRGRCSALTETVQAIVDYMAEPKAGLTLPLDLRGTAFQVRVWEALRKIPPGQTRSYAELATMIGAPRAVRAVAGDDGDGTHRSSQSVFMAPVCCLHGDSDWQWCYSDRDGSVLCRRRLDRRQASEPEWSGHSQLRESGDRDLRDHGDLRGRRQRCGKHIASGSWDLTIRIWDVETGKELRRLEGHTQPIMGVAHWKSDTVVAAEDVTVEFENGFPVAINGKRVWARTS